jgi:hypothetical protein
MARRLWFSITEKDCRFLAKRGSGNGGQKKQKTSSAIQCFHDESGAMGESEDSREQKQNRKLAFGRMVKSPEFQGWLKLKIEAGLGHVEIEEATEQGNRVSRKLRMDEV